MRNSNILRKRTVKFAIQLEFMANIAAKNPYQSDLCCHNWTTKFRNFWAALTISTYIFDNGFSRKSEVLSVVCKNRMKPDSSQSYVLQHKKDANNTHTHLYTLCIIPWQLKRMIHSNCTSGIAICICTYIQFTCAMAANVNVFFLYVVWKWKKKITPATVNEVRATSLAKIRFLLPIKLSLNLFRSIDAQIHAFVIRTLLWLNISSAHKHGVKEHLHGFYTSNTCKLVAVAYVHLLDQRATLPCRMACTHAPQ